MKQDIAFCSHKRSLSYQELMISGGQDYIGEACAVFAFIAYSSGGAVIANPVGGAITGFCVGYTLGSVIAGWIS